MELEERTLEQAGERCEECGAKLTARELELTLERGGPTLCSVHRTENAAVDAEDDDLDAPVG
jgi:hypothetical protein